MSIRRLGSGKAFGTKAEARRAFAVPYEIQLPYGLPEERREGRRRAEGDRGTKSIRQTSNFYQRAPVCVDLPLTSALFGRPRRTFRP